MRFLIVITFLAATSVAQARKGVPLMPQASYRQASYRPPEESASRPTVRERYRYYRDTARETVWGFELGVIGRQQNADGFLGMALLKGGRLMFETPLWQKYRLRPSVGYFMQSSGEAGVSVTEHTLEVGAGLYLPLGRPKTTRFQIGIQNRLDLTISRIDVLDNSGSSGIGFLYRLGPALGMNVAMGNRTAFVMDIETTFAVTHNFRFHTGLSAGFLFTLD